MWNDLFGWSKDLECKTSTYFLSEARRSKYQNETIIEWIIKKGFYWGIEILQTWMVDLKSHAKNLNSPYLLAYLGKKESMLLKQVEEMDVGLQNLAKIQELLI